MEPRHQPLSKYEQVDPWSHFTLVHVPGTHHTSDGLSRWKPQPGDKEEPDDNFEDWIDNVNGFLHFLNPHSSIHHCITPILPIASYVHSVTHSRSHAIK